MPPQLFGSILTQLGISGFRAQWAAALGFAREMAAGATGTHIPMGFWGGSAASPIGKGPVLEEKGVSCGLVSHVSPHPPASWGQASLPIPAQGVLGAPQGRSWRFRQHNRACQSLISMSLPLPWYFRGGAWKTNTNPQSGWVSFPLSSAQALQAGRV